jgi:uncharacterized membrane protein (UPF0127 family)
MTQASLMSLPRVARLAVAIAATTLALAASSACTQPSDPGDTASGARPAASPLALEPTPAIRPRVVLGDGTEIGLELAITPEELAQGLMYRPHLPDDRGMLLIFSEERLPSIWMMNTLVALDLVYLDDLGMVVDVIPQAQPCPGEPCPRFVPKQPARAVLELVAGTVERHGMREGDRLEFSHVPGFPVTEGS